MTLASVTNGSFNVRCSQEQHDTMDGAPRTKAEELASSRPFTTMGSATLHLESLQQSNNGARRVATAGASGTGQLQAAEGEFDVRKFILEQKSAGEPLHQSSLFRPAPFLEKQSQRMARLSPRSSQHHNSTPELIKRSKKLLPKMELSVSKSVEILGLSSSDATSKAAKAGHGSANQLREEDYDTVSHFYTVEKMAESCCNAAQSRNRTWHFPPGSEERSKSNNSGGGITGVERPSRRVDVLDLEKCFEVAMQFANKKNDWDVACNEKTAMIDRDFMLIEARVAQKYMSSSSGVDHHPLSTSAPPDAGDDKAVENQRVLAKLFFEQKWSDVVLGELEAMLTVSFLEQGVLLRKARIQYAQAFYQLEKLYCAGTKELKQALRDVEQTRQEISRASERHERDTDAMKQQYEGEIKRLSGGFEARKEEMERKVVESKEQMTKMGDTMKTLNTIFRQMREDTETVKAVELRENYNKLEKKHELCREEIEKLRPLVQENQRLTAEKDMVKKELAALKESVANTSAVLAAKDATIASLMEQHSDMIAAQELQAAQEEERRRRAQDEADEEEEDLRESSAPTCSATGEESQPRSRAQQNSGGVCVRCKQELTRMSMEGSLADHSSQETSGSGDTEAADVDSRKSPEVRKRRIQCLYFRILLPNLRGRRPQREMAWTLSCMRSIMFAKQIDDAMCRRNGGAHPLRIRMPEFVYAWFSPWHSIKEDKNQDDLGGGGYAEHSDDDSQVHPRAILTTEQQHTQADEDRWCLYYGVKQLVQEGYLEAKLFLSLLDEKYGEDELVFMLYCYRVLDILIGGRLNYGPLRDTVSYTKFAQEYDALGLGESNGSRDKRVPKTLWISPRHASLATGVVLSKATEAERVALDQKIMNYVVTNVPVDERPSVFLPADQQPQLSTKGKHCKNGHRSDQPPDQEDADDEDAAPQQYIDANLWVELMMLEYKEEQAHRRAAIRLMFQTASSTAASSAGVSTRQSESRQSAALVSASAATMDMEQFRIMIRTLNDEIPSFMVAVLFRNTYVKGGGAVNFDAFMDVAESAQFFSSCMRLESPAAGVAWLVNGVYHPTIAAALSTSSRATYLVDKFFVLMRKEISASVEALPLWSRSSADQLSYELSSCLEDGEAVNSDGVRLLTLLHRLIDNLLLVKLVKHEVMGGLFHSKTIFSIEKALNALLECVRLRDKSSAEILIDAVRQKLCVQRMQTVFREHLRRDQGAPLAMRSLLRHSYGRRDSVYRGRLAERPLKWLLLVISAVFRHSMRPERHALILGLSMTSGGIRGGGSNAAAQGSSAMNGGIGPAPKPMLMEIIYDFFLDKFGTRWEAEKLVHDVFVNCRAHAKANATVMLFSALCSMSNAAPDDSLLGQNEALAFLHAIFRSGLHNFAVINPPIVISGNGDSSIPSDETSAAAAATYGGGGHREAEHHDWIPIDKAETILLGAFSKLSTDQTNRLRTRIEEAAAPSSSTNSVSSPVKGTAEVPLRSMSVGRLPSIPRIEAGAFLLLALNEWKRYVVQRMNEVKMVCCRLDDDEMRHFEAFNQIETIATVLQKSEIVYHTDDLCAIFRRFCSTEPHRTTTDKSARTGTSSSQHVQEDLLSDRLAAACFPVLAREPLTELQTIENSAMEPFKLPLNPAQNYELLVESWNGYRKQCVQLLEELRRVGKNNDIQAESLSRTSSAASSSSGGVHTSAREVLYLSSPASADRLSSQDVAQLEAVYLLFVERMERLQEVFERERMAVSVQSGPGSSKRNSVVGISVDGSLALVDDMHSHMVMVNETWKIFRQVLLGFTKLRALASLGAGMLPDEWSEWAEARSKSPEPTY